jgi:hypothetical protein
MAADVARRHPANNSDSTTRARHTEIARRYAWQAQQRRKRHDEKPDPARLLTLIRMRELERLFERRYGRLLPDDDAGRDDLIVAAHHIALLRGDVIKHIVDWARAWAPWMPSAEAERLAERVAAEPRKWTADTLAWRLRLSWAERTDLRITTIGAFDMSKAEREVERKRRRREAERARRAKRSTERPRGRPKKCVASRDSTIAGHGFSPDADGSAREAPDTGSDVNASTKENLNTSRAASSLLDLVEGQTPSPPSPNSRAAPPPEVTAEVIKIARSCAEKRFSIRCFVGEREARRLLDLFWPRHMERVYRCQSERARTFSDWQFGFTDVLDREYAARQSFQERRRKWERDRERVRAEWERSWFSGGRALMIAGRAPPRLQIVHDRIEREREQHEARRRISEECRRRYERRYEAAKKVALRRKLVSEGKPPILDSDFILHDSPTWPLLQRWDALSPDEHERVIECWIAEQKDLSR